MRIKLFLLFLLGFTLALPLQASSPSSLPTLLSSKSKISVIAHPLKPTKMDKETIFSIILCAFIGASGIHRVIMGGSPLLIIAYILTFGGFFFLLPFMDFVRLWAEPEHYKNNNKFLAAFGAM